MNVSYNKRDKCYFGKYKNPIDNKWKTKFIPVSCGTEAEAKVWFAAFLDNLQQTQVVPVNLTVVAKVHTITSFYPEWEEYLTKVKTNKSGDPLDPSTIQGWLGKVRIYVLTHSLGNLPLTVDKFTPLAVVEWVEGLKRMGLAKYTIKDIVSALRTMIGDARKKGRITLPYNPIADEIVKSEIPVGETRAGKDNPIHLSKKSSCVLMSCESESIPLYRKVKNSLALTSGARSAELQGLAWKHVDLEAGTIEIVRQLNKGGQFPTFKGCKKKSERTLPLHPLAVLALTYWKKKALKTGNEDPIFPDPKTGLYCKANAARALRDDLRAADLSTQYQGKFNIDQHATRRTFRTLLADSGVDDTHADALMGHTKKGVRKFYIKDNLEKFIPAINLLPFSKVELGWIK